MKNHILLIRCSDQKGLIALIAGELFKNGLNVVNNNEFVDPQSSTFFMRSEFTEDVNVPNLRDSLIKILPDDAQVKIIKKEAKKIIILATKESHCLGDLLLRCAYGHMAGEIVAVIANHKILQPLVEKFDIPFHLVEHEGLNRDQHTKNVQEVIDRYEIDYLVLAKYMRILPSWFVKSWNNKIINIHHSFLPAFIGANPYRQAFERGVKIIGATAHFVNDNLDEGPIIHQDITTINHAQDVKSLSEAGQDVEKIVLSTALNLVFEERVFVSGNKTIIFD